MNINKEKRIQKTKRHYRIKKFALGTAERPRMSVYKSNKNFYIQIIDDDKGVTLLGMSSKSLKLKNGTNIESAKKLGAELAKKAKEKNINEVVFDRGGNLYHGSVKALADSAREQGLKF